jgi:hypothetical protein
MIFGYSTTTDIYSSSSTSVFVVVVRRHGRVGMFHCVVSFQQYFPATTMLGLIDLGSAFPCVFQGHEPLEAGFWTRSKKSMDSGPLSRTTVR